MRGERLPRGSKRPDNSRKARRPSDSVNHYGINGYSGYKMDDCWTLYPEKRLSNTGNKNSLLRNNAALNNLDREFRARIVVTNIVILPLTLQALSQTAREP